MPTFGHAGSKWRLRAKPEQPQTLPPACLASGTSGFTDFGLFLIQPMLNCLNSARAPTKAAGTSPYRATPALSPGPASAPVWAARSGAGRAPAPEPVGAVGRSRPGAGPEPFHKCLIPAQSRSSATHKHLSSSSHPRVPTAAPSPSTTELRRKGAGGDPTESPRLLPPGPRLSPQHGGGAGTTRPIRVWVLTLYNNKFGFYFGAGGRRVVMRVCLWVTEPWGRCGRKGRTEVPVTADVFAGRNKTPVPAVTLPQPSIMNTRGSAQVAGAVPVPASPRTPWSGFPGLCSAPRPPVPPGIAWPSGRTEDKPFQHHGASGARKSPLPSQPRPALPAPLPP